MSRMQAPQLDINTVAAGGGSRLFFRSGVFQVWEKFVCAQRAQHALQSSSSKHLAIKEQAPPLSAAPLSRCAAAAAPAAPATAGGP